MKDLYQIKLDWLTAKLHSELEAKYILDKLEEIEYAYFIAREESDEQTHTGEEYDSSN